MKAFSFEYAKPVWPAGREREMNVSLLLAAEAPEGAEAVLRIAAHARYQIFVNGEFFAEGPARAAHGFYRVSVYALKARLTRPRNVISILAVNYAVNSFSCLDAPGFVCAELVCGGAALAATGAEPGFRAAEETHRVQKTPRFSYQRPATEAYLYDVDWDLPRTAPDWRPAPCALAETEPKTFIEREVPYCEYEVRRAVSLLSRGELRPGPDAGRRDDTGVQIPRADTKGWPPEEFEAFPVREVLAWEPAVFETAPAPAAPRTLPGPGFCVYDMGVNTTGFLRIDARAEWSSTLYAVFGEKLDARGVPQPGADGTQNCVKWTLEGGRAYRLVSFAPYTYRYLWLLCPEGEVTVTEAAQITEACPAARLTGLKPMPDAALQKIYGAAVETFRQNATDIFMDCPSRERAGWLCDSFFTARTEYALTGKSTVERAFLENFLLPRTLPDVPAGMLPMCYPSDHPGHGYIPNWAMWYVLELEEYAARSGDRALIERARPRVYALAEFFTKYENETGLLQNLESWVFVEWSAANDYVQDVNYPSNMLYARFLEAVAALYGDAALSAKAARVKAEIRRQALRDDGFFADNAAFDETGVLKRTEHRTETCQYYAFFTGTATPETDPALYETMLSVFGPRRKETGAYPEMPESNAFIGNYLRLELLFRWGKTEQLLREIRAFFLPMAEQTGTLWENMTDRASCCHGFASHVAVWLNAVCG